MLHARNRDRLAAVRNLIDRGAAAVTGDLSNVEETRGVGDRVNRLGPIDAVIHNAGVISGPHTLPVNVKEQCGAGRRAEHAAAEICPKQAIAKVRVVRGNAARLVRPPALCLCNRRNRRCRRCHSNSSRARP